MSTPNAPPPEKMAGFEDLPIQLRNRIYDMVLPRDKVVVTSKAIRGRHWTSRFTMVFRTKQTRHEYQDVLEQRIINNPGIIRVNIVDYNFNNFLKYIRWVRMKYSSHGDVLRPYFFPFSDIPILKRDIRGPYFAASLIFTKRFEDDQQPLRNWMKQSKKLEEKF